MKDNPGDSQECWLTRVEAIKSMFGIELHGGMSSDGVSQRVKKAFQSKFQIFWKDQISDRKVGQDNVSHNKLRLYCQLKSCFAQEPYISKVTNRSQRSWLSRVRTSAHSLGIERAGIVVYLLLTGYVCTVHPHKKMVWEMLGMILEMEAVEYRQKWIVKYTFS